MNTLHGPLSTLEDLVATESARVSAGIGGVGVHRPANGASPLVRNHVNSPAAERTHSDKTGKKIINPSIVVYV